MRKCCTDVAPEAENVAPEMLHPRCCILKRGRLTEEGTEEEVVYYDK